MRLIGLISTEIFPFPVKAKRLLLTISPTIKRQSRSQRGFFNI
jgi:hypothetical protein